MADTKKPALKVRDFSLWELERIASDALGKAPRCVAGRRVNIERLLQEGFGVRILSYADLARQWKTYAFINTTGKYVFVDADLLDNVGQAKKYRFTLAEELAHLLIHTSLFANCETIEARLAIEDAVNEVRRNRLESNARALASAILMPEKTLRPFVESGLEQFVDEHGHVLVDELASAISQEYDVNFRAAKRRLKLLGYHRTHGWDLD